MAKQESTPASPAIDVAIAAPSKGGVVTARRAGELKDLGLDLDPTRVSLPCALQNLAKAINVAFQSDVGENGLEAVYQAAIVLRGEVRVMHKEYFGFEDNWFGQFGRLLKSMSLTLQGPDPGSPEGRKRIQEKGPASIRGLLNLFVRKAGLLPEYEDRVPALVEQMFDRLEASGLVVGWNRAHWEIVTSRVGLDVLVRPREEPKKG